LPPPMNLASLERAELEEVVVRLGARGFHGRQLFRWIHQRGARDFQTMTDVPAALRNALAVAHTIEASVIETRQTSADGTVKFGLRLADGRRVEAVYIPDTPRQTFCISTQVGCAMACEFCLTGKMGLVRHLTAGEIAGQARQLAEATGLVGRSFNIVLMGMGEPLHNYDATMKALRILTDPGGLAVPLRRVTLSTVGLVPGLERLAQERRLSAFSCPAATPHYLRVCAPGRRQRHTRRCTKTRRAPERHPCESQLVAAE